MDIAKVTSKGQITIPIDIRKKLGVKEGDKILFLEEEGRVVLMNSSMTALKNAQAAFTGAAAEAGLKDESDVAAMIAQFRRERMEG